MEIESTSAATEPSEAEGPVLDLAALGRGDPAMVEAFYEEARKAAREALAKP